ncbi:FAD-dependent oxidoreductase [Kribbella deserti]|uniref:FAD-dependent oxidoreductase n=1 Tax=Kribbella deserti TaxID=1926257 RepID=A0ABV6QNC3_9ACTN
MRKAVVIGAGPVGCLAAQTLADLGYAVEVYEKRPEYGGRPAASVGRTINLSVSPRGLRALAAVGADKEVVDSAVAMDRRVVHQLQASVETRYGDPSWCNYSVGRNDLNKTLYRQARYHPGIRFEFGASCHAIDFERRRVVLDRSDGRRLTAGYDLLIGADGTHSSVRSAMAQTGLTTVWRTPTGSGYTELTLRPADTLELQRSAIHVWPRGGFFLVGLPNQDETFRCTLVLPDVGEPTFTELADPVRRHAVMAENFPDVYAGLGDLDRAIEGRRPAKIWTVRADRLVYRSSVALVGDAAHTIAPFLGQGINLGFEDCLMLGRALAAAPDDPKTALFEYAADRVVNGDAAAQLSMLNFDSLAGASAASSNRRTVRDRVVPIDSFMVTAVNFSQLTYGEVLNQLDAHPVETPLELINIRSGT